MSEQGPPGWLLLLIVAYAILAVAADVGRWLKRRREERSWRGLDQTKRAQASPGQNDCT